MIIPAQIDLKGISSTISLSVEEMFDYMSEKEKERMLDLLKKETPVRFDFDPAYTYTESEFYDVIKESWRSRIHLDPSKLDAIKGFLRSLDLY